MFASTSQGPIYYQLQGAGSVLVLLHPDGTSSDVFEADLKDLVHDFSVLVPDLIGCGRSPQRAFSNDHYRENAKAVIDLLRTLRPAQQANLVGCGGGAIVALWAAILDSARIQAVVADSVCEFYRAQELGRLLHYIAGAQRKSAKHWLGDQARIVLAELARVYEELVEQKRSNFDWRLDQVVCPVLLTGSATDDVLHELPARLQEIADQLGHVEKRLFAAAEHPAMLSESKRFWPQALRFLAQVMS